MIVFGRVQYELTLVCRVICGHWIQFRLGKLIEIGRRKPIHIRVLVNTENHNRENHLLFCHLEMLSLPLLSCIVHFTIPLRRLPQAVLWPQSVSLGGTDQFNLKAFDKIISVAIQKRESSIRITSNLDYCRFWCKEKREVEGVGNIFFLTSRIWQSVEIIVNLF